MFFKLNSNIEMLHALGNLPWKQYSDIPAKFIYNMDEIGNDTTKHRNKVLYKKTDANSQETNATRAFMQTSEGDGCMPWHVMVCLTT